jgi:type I restriction enzyme S subunit
MICTQSILAKAFRGDLVPQDPNDEPASVLLERIQSQRQDVGAARSQPRRKGVTAAGKAGIR